MTNLKDGKGRVLFMKKLVMGLLYVLLIFCLFACQQEQDSEGTSAKNTQTSMQTSTKTDQMEVYFEELRGDYQAQESGDGTKQYVGSYWHLDLAKSHKKPYFALYDNEAGNPGVEGFIIRLTKDQIVVKINQDLYEGLPGDWEDDGKTITISYEKKGNLLFLSNHQTTVKMVKLEEQR